MTIPRHEDMMLSILRQLQDGHTKEMRQITESMAKVFNLTEADLAQRLPSGTDYTFANRVSWARTYLKKAGLLESPGRSLIKITELGLKALAENLTQIDDAYLRQFPGYLEFMAVKPPKTPKEKTLQVIVDTPEEMIESGYSAIRAALAKELLDSLGKTSPSYFERIVIEVLVKMGYGGSLKDAGEAVGRAGDGGIDGVIKEDKLGLDTIYVQAKRWSTSVGRPTVQEFVGSLEGVRAQRGIIITTSKFTSEAEAYVQQIGKRIVLIDGPTLADLMIEHDVGVTPVKTFQLKRIDSDYFTEE